MHLYEVLKRPVDTEKTRFQGEMDEPQYSFEVDERANKHLVKAAVEQNFSVDVLKVRIINVSPRVGAMDGGLWFVDRVGRRRL